MYELVGRHWSSLKPYKFKGTKKQIAENHMILKGSSAMVTEMNKKRVKAIKAGIK